MPKAISNTSPLLYLYRIDALNWLAELFGGIWTPSAVVAELGEGGKEATTFPIPRVTSG
jgi:predicted nucleic acid-binding protein